MRKPLVTLVASGLVLTGCGSGAPRDGTGAAATGVSSATGFDATDACKILPREKVGAITGLKVEKSTLSSVNQPTATSPAFSACTYSFAAGGTLGFFARRSPESDTPETVAQTRKALIDGMGAKTADVAGIGTTAFSARPMDQLHVFFGDDKYIYFMIDRAPIAKPVPLVERALAHAVIG